MTSQTPAFWSNQEAPITSRTEAPAPQDSRQAPDMLEWRHFTEFLFGLHLHFLRPTRCFLQFVLFLISSSWIIYINISPLPKDRNVATSLTHVPLPESDSQKESDPSIHASVGFINRKSTDAWKAYAVSTCPLIFCYVVAGICSLGKAATSTSFLVRKVPFSPSSICFDCYGFWPVHIFHTSLSHFRDVLTVSRRFTVHRSVSPKRAGAPTETDPYGPPEGLLFPRKPPAT